MNIEILKEENKKAWDEFVNNHEEGRFVHLSAYKDIIEKSYNYKGYFLFAQENNEILAVFPFFQLKNILFQKKLMSQPFSEYGGILFKNNLSNAKMEKIIVEFKLHIVKISPQQKKFCVEIHGQSDQVPFLKNYLIQRPLYKIASLKLDNYEKLYSKFDYQIKKAIKKAERERVVIRDETSPEGIKHKFYPLYLRYLKSRHGTPPYPLNFFTNCYYFAPDNIKLFLAEIDNNVVAALWGFFTKKRVQISYNPSLEKYFIQRPNDLLHAKFIEWSCKNRFNYFDFGPARYCGQTRFKEKWGVDFSDYSYFYVTNGPMKCKPFTAEAKSVKLFGFFWKYLIPKFIADFIGPILRKKTGK